MRWTPTINLYDLGLLIVFAYAGWQWWCSLFKSYAWLKAKGLDDSEPVVWTILAFVGWLFFYMIGGTLFFCEMLIAAWQPW